MIVFICGAPNAGKSTVGKIVAARLHAAFIEGDDIRKIFYMKTVEQVREEIVESIAALVRVAAKHQEHIVIAYPLWNEDFASLQRYLGDISLPQYFIALSPSLDVALTNRGARELESWEGEWIKELYARGVNNPTFAQSIDNTNMTPEECAEEVIERLKIHD
jgi:adenylate kinase family enzyme